MNRKLLLLLVAIAMMVISACGGTEPALNAAAKADKFSQKAADDDGAAAPSIKVTEVIAEVSDNVLSVKELWPNWEDGGDVFSVPEGYFAWLTSDPGYLYLGDETDVWAQFASRSVVLLPHGEYRLDTYHSAEGNLNGWLEATRIELFTMDAVLEQSMRMLDAEGNPAPILDLRGTALPANAMAMIQNDADVFVAPEVNVLPGQTPVVEPTADVTATNVQTNTATSVSPATIEMACVPENSAFVDGYEAADGNVTLTAPDGKFILAGHDPASVGGHQTKDKGVTLVYPGKSVVISGLGRDPSTNRAYIYACLLSEAPNEQLINSWIERESANGRGVELIVVE